MSHLIDAGVAPVGLNLENIILFGITCEKKCSVGNFYRFNIINALFKRTSLMNSNFIYANLENASVIRSNLSGSNFYQENLTHTFFYESNLSNTDLIQANIFGAIFVNSNLKNTKFNHLAYYEKIYKDNIPCISHAKKETTFFKKCSEKN